MRVVHVPPSFDHRSVDDFLDAAVRAGGGRVLVDAHRVRWVDPSGMLALLVAGRVARTGGEGRPVLRPPDNGEVLSYLGRMGFFAEAEGIFEIGGRVPPRRSMGASDVLLEVTAIDSHDDVRRVVSRVQARSGAILAGRLGLPVSAVIQFAIVLSEVCQNIVEHAGDEAIGWVAVQAYNWAKRLGRFAAVVSVMDSGVGFRSSLQERHAATHGTQWNDATALQAAFLRGLSRLPETGRGQGLRQILRQVEKWGGALRARSGTARLALGPAWDDAPPMVTGLSSFPGAQITIIIPAAMSQEPC